MGEDFVHDRARKWWTDGVHSLGRTSASASVKERLGDTTFTSASRENPIFAAAPKSSVAPNNEASIDPTTNAIDAINALSDLQKRWSVSVGEKRKESELNIETSSLKKRKRRKRGKKNNGGTARDDGEWIDVEEDDSLAIYQKPGVCQRGYDLTSGLGGPDFPPLTKSDNPALVTLGQWSTSKVTTYSSILRGALDQGDVGARIRTNSVNELLDDNNVIGAMDLSDEEQDQGVPPKAFVAKDNNRGQGGDTEGMLDSNVPVNASSTSTDPELISYLSILRSALDQGDGGARDLKNHVNEFLDDNAAVGVMGISDEEQNQGVQPKAALAIDKDNDRGQGR